MKGTRQTQSSMEYFLFCALACTVGRPAVAVATWDFGEIAVKEAAKYLLQGKVRCACMIVRL